MPGRIAWSLFGGVIAVGRFATILLITALVASAAASPTLSSCPA